MAQDYDVVLKLLFRSQSSQAVQEIASEFTVCYCFLRIAICRRQQSHVDLNLFPAAETAHRALFDNAQQFCLKQRRHFSDFIQ